MSRWINTKLYPLVSTFKNVTILENKLTGNRMTSQYWYIDHHFHNVLDNLRSNTTICIINILLTLLDIAHCFFEINVRVWTLTLHRRYGNIFLLWLVVSEGLVWHPFRHNLTILKVYICTEVWKKIADPSSIVLPVYRKRLCNKDCVK